MAGRLFSALLVISAATAQYEVPRKVNEYPAHASWPRFAIGAEFMGHTIPVDDGTLFAGDYLVVEVAIYPGNQPVMISDAHFTLRVNGKKSVLNPESPGFVASSLKYPDWEQRPTLIGEAGSGNGSVIVGAPAPTPRFPGDRTGNAPIGLPRKQPDSTDAAGNPRQTVTVDEAIARAALPEGSASKPRKGSLFFAYKGKLKSIHTLELLYDDTHGDVHSLSVLPPATP